MDIELPLRNNLGKNAWLFNYYWPFKVLEYRIQITLDKIVKAIAGDNNDEIDLLDERGCPTDPVIFPGLTQLPNSRDLQGNFEAFKFSDTSVVRLDSYFKYSKIMVIYTFK